MASLIHTEERAERLSVCTEQVELQGREGFGGARPGKDTNRALRNDTEFAREMESAAGLGCNRYCEPEKFPTRDCGGIATVSVWRGKLQFSVFSDLPDARASFCATTPLLGAGTSTPDDVTTDDGHTC